MASGAINPSLNFARVASNFGSAAAHYDQHAQIQRDISLQLREQWPTLDTDSKVFDLGCGTGYDSEWLCQQGLSVHAIDLAAGMLKATKERCGRDDNSSISTHLYNVSELSQLGLQVDAIWSNCMLQWAGDLKLAMSQIEQSLNPGGVFIGSLFTAGSLNELRQAWLAVDNKPHLIELPNADDTQIALTAAGLTIEWSQPFNTLAYFDDLNGIRDHLRGLGATNAHRSRQTGLVGKSALATLKAALEQQRTHNGIPLTWQAWLFKAVKPL